MVWATRQLIIEEKNPLKQGLKPDDQEQINSQRTIEEKNPLKQGLKRQYERAFENW